jgi:hypothetical protein
MMVCVVLIYAISCALKCDGNHVIHLHVMVTNEIAAAVMKFVQQNLGNTAMGHSTSYRLTVDGSRCSRYLSNIYCTPAGHS